MLSHFLASDTRKRTRFEEEKGLRDQIGRKVTQMNVEVNENVA
jgi:hypothetical protein